MEFDFWLGRSCDIVDLVLFPFNLVELFPRAVPIGIRFLE